MAEEWTGPRSAGTSCRTAFVNTGLAGCWVLSIFLSPAVGNIYPLQILASSAHCGSSLSPDRSAARLCVWVGATDRWTCLCDLSRGAGTAAAEPLVPWRWASEPWRWGQRCAFDSSCALYAPAACEVTHLLTRPELGSLGEIGNVLIAPKGLRVAILTLLPVVGSPRTWSLCDRPMHPTSRDVERRPQRRRLGPASS